MFIKNVHVVLLLAAITAFALYFFCISQEQQFPADSIGLIVNVSSIIKGVSSMVRAAHISFMSSVRLSFAKAMYVDFPILLSLMSFEKSVPLVGIATLFQEIRISGKQYLMSVGFDQNVAAVSAGIAGGVVKYSIVGLNPIIGSVATVAYELCGNFESCYNNPAVNVPVVLAIETFDQTAHGFLKTGGISMETVQFGIWLGSYVVFTAYGFLTPAMNAVFVCLLFILVFNYT